METSFYVDISIQTTEGPKRFARFELGNNRNAATGLYKRLKGSPEVNPTDMLYIELTETFNGLPVNIDIVTCNLQELAINTMMITQEVFRLVNLEGGKDNVPPGR